MLEFDPLQIKPGTEVLLYGAMAKVIVDRGQNVQVVSLWAMNFA